MHLRYQLSRGPGDYAPDEHPEKVMKDLGITYQHATPKSVFDQWWFWNCKNVPDPLPKYLTVLDLDPNDAVGYGLSKEDALCIMNG
jgi:hypothetical protein